MNTYQDNSGFSSTRYVCVQPHIDNNHNSVPSACMNSLAKLITYVCVVFESFWSRVLLRKGDVKLQWVSLTHWPWCPA